MPKPTQATRNIAIDTPLGEDVLLLRSFSGHEEISRLFEFDLDLLSEDYEINFDDIIGQNVTVRMELPEGGTRYWNGYINSFVQGGSTSVQFAQYQATMVPWLWFLTQTSDCRIFQEKTVPDIIKQVFNDLGFSDIEDRLSGGYRTWTYCVQYRETDFNFVSRLMEQEGIYYYFLHEQGKCTIVLCDSLSKHDPYGKYGTIDFISDTAGSAILERISEWTVEKRIRSGKFAHVDYNFEKPSTSLMSIEEDQKSHARADYEIYDYPGEYSEKTDGDKYAKLRMEELTQSHEVCAGQSDSRGICPGFLFTLAKHSRKDQNREYIIVSIGHQASAAPSYETSDQVNEEYDCSFTVIPSSVQFRPERSTPKPIIQGSQTAIVTGPSGEEIYPDKHGRVKVQFHWDREGKRDENSSCWIRVSQAWAGAGWGAMYIPRIGHEVIVDFIEGDPDRPIITGRVYHGTNKPPYGLPAEKTKSTIKSDSSLGSGGSNEFRFEDKKGSEEIYLHGQKDWTIAIENDKNQTVGNNETLSVGSNRDKTVGVNQSETIGANKTIKVGSNHSETIGANKTETVAINTAETIGVAKELTIGGAYQVSVGAAMNETIGGAKAEEIGGIKSVNVGVNSSENIGSNKSVDAGKDISESAGKDVTIKSGKKMSLNSGDDFSIDGSKKGVIQIADQLTIKVGSASITMKKSGDILIQGKKIEIQGQTDVKLNATKITSEAKAKSLTKGAMVNVEASGINTIKGALVKIN